jgi:hypothetical protein
MAIWNSISEIPNERWVPVPECIGYDEHHDEEAEEEDDERGEDVPDVLTHKNQLHTVRKVNDFFIASWDVINQTLPGQE